MNIACQAVILRHPRPTVRARQGTLRLGTPFADPKTDFVFKRFFGTEERKPLLIALLNHLLELEDEHRILDVQHLSNVLGAKMATDVLSVR